VKILYICTHNRCRSILSEAITNHLSKGKILAKSAGSQPAGQVHPLSLMHLQQVGISTDYLKISRQMSLSPSVTRQPKSHAHCGLVTR
jgi:arsenate reductase